jgi:hypothetical protein
MLNSIRGEYYNYVGSTRGYVKTNAGDRGKRKNFVARKGKRDYA